MEHLEEGNKENKAKKNAYTIQKGKAQLQGRLGDAKKVGRRAIKQGQGIDGLRKIHNSAAHKQVMRKYTSESTNPLYELLELVASGDQEQADELFGELLGQRVTEILDGVKEDMAQTIFASTEGEVIEEGNKENKAKKNAAIGGDTLSRARFSKSQGKQDGDLKKIRRTAVAKHIIKKIMTKESVEQLDEMGPDARRNQARKNDYTDSVGREFHKNVEKHRDPVASKHRNFRRAGRKNMPSNKGREGGDLLAIKNNAKSKLAWNKRMAANNKMSESVEQLDELSKKTLGNYVNKAASDAFGKGHDAGSAKFGSEKSMKGYDKGSKRLAGIRKATKKLSEAMSDEMKARVKADMEKRRAAKNAALDSAKKEMEGWKPDKKDIRKIYKKDD